MRWLSCAAAPTRGQHSRDGDGALRWTRCAQPESLALARARCGSRQLALSPIFVAGFYYKTFMWPAALWEKLYEPAIRRAAGLGRASAEADPDSYEKAYAFCDVLIIGAGAAGLAAALSAARCGARVILCDEDFLLGGRLNGERHEIDGMSGHAWTRQVEAELLANPETRILRRTTVFGVYDGGMSGTRTLGALERVADHLPIPPAHQPRQRLWRIIAKRTVLAAGAVERPIVFGGNDRPGVMMASAVRTYVNRFGVIPGRHAALFTTSDDGWKTAFDLAAAGVRVAAIIDARSVVSPVLIEEAKRIDTRVFLQRAGGRCARLDRITVRDRAGLSHFQVDTLAVAGGWNPNVALCTHLGGRPRWSDAIAALSRATCRVGWPSSVPLPALSPLRMRCAKAQRLAQRRPRQPASRRSIIPKRV